jgi:hypothetical protein
VSVSIDDTALYAGLDRMLDRIFAGVERGLARGAAVPEDMMRTDPAHGDVTGAAHDSSTVYLIGGTHTGARESAEGYAIAQLRHRNAIGSYGGGPLSQDSGVTLGPDERGLIYTRFVDYADELEQSDKAVIGPTLQQTASLMTQFAADGSKEALS